MRQGLLVLSALLAMQSIGCPRGDSGPTTPEGEDEGGDVAAPMPEPEPPPPAPVKIQMRAIHVAATASKAPVAVSFAVGDEPLAVAEELAFGATSGYQEAELAPETAEVEIALTAEGFEAEAGPSSVTDGAAHTAVIYSDSETRETLHVSVFADVAATPEGGMQARFFNAVVGWDSIDVCTPGETRRAPGEVVFGAVAYGGLATDGYVEIDPESPQLQLREADEETPCSGRVVGAVTLTPPEGADPTGQNLTFVAIGRASGRPAVPRALLVCTDAPTETPACFRLPMRAR